MEISSAPVTSEILKVDSAQVRSNAHESTHAPGTAPTAADSVSLTDSARQLQDIQTVVAATPAVDSERVAALRAAIADGSYRVDPQGIADSLLAQERAALE